jgi:hypothetical protein
MTTALMNVLNGLSALALFHAASSAIFFAGYFVTNRQSLGLTGFGFLVCAGVTLFAYKNLHTRSLEACLDSLDSNPGHVEIALLASRLYLKEGETEKSEQLLAQHLGKRLAALKEMKP